MARTKMSQIDALIVEEDFDVEVNAYYCLMAIADETAKASRDVHLQRPIMGPVPEIVDEIRF